MQTEMPLTVQVVEMNGNQGRVLVASMGVEKVAYANLRRTPVFPKVGERWVIDRQYNNVWTFAAKIERTTPGNPAGVISQFAGDGDNAPDGWCFCDGRHLAVSDYPELYAALGDAWGDMAGVRIGATVTNGTEWDDAVAVSPIAVDEGDLIIVHAASPGVFPENAFVAPSGLGTVEWTPIWTSSVPRPHGGLLTAAWWGIMDDSGDDEITVGMAESAPYLVEVIVVPGCSGIGRVETATNLETGIPNRVGLAVEAAADALVLALVANTEQEASVTVNDAWASVTEDAVGPDARSVSAWSWVNRPPAPARIGFQATFDTYNESWHAAAIELLSAGDDYAFPVPDIDDVELGDNFCRYIVYLGGGPSIIEPEP